MDDYELRAQLPTARMVVAGGARIAMLHDAGPAEGAWGACGRASPTPTRSSSATPTSAPRARRDEGLQIFNPGSPTDRSRQPTHTMGQAWIGEDGAVSFELIDLG